MLISLVAIGVLAQTYKVETVTLKNVDAKYVYEQAKGLLENVHCIVDPETNAIAITGVKNEVSEAIRILQLFDVKAMSVDLAIDIESVRFGWKKSARVWTPINGKWSFEHEASNTQFTVSPRVNEDGSATITLTSSDHTKKPASSVFRVKRDETATFAIGGKGNWVTILFPSERPKRDWRTEVKVTVRGYDR